MKKEYVKPIVMVEFFQLDAAIASTCSDDKKISLNHYMNSCTLEETMPGLGYFGNACTHDVQVEGDGNDLICYHGPTPASSVFMNS